jgi:hypothetical protein
LIQIKFLDRPGRKSERRFPPSFSSKILAWAHLIYVLAGKRTLSDKFLKLLGLRKVYSVEQ